MMRRFLFTVVAVTGPLLVALLVTEVVIRIVRGSPHRFAGHHRIFCEYDATLGWRKLANFSATRRTSEYEVTETFNSRGLRGPERPYQKPMGHYRILMLGDSFLEGYSVQQEQTVSAVLERELRQLTGREIEVINAGTGGYSTDQEYLFFRDEGRKYEPDLTILMFHDNDVHYNTRTTYLAHQRGSKPMFRLESGELRLVNVPVPRPAAPSRLKKLLAERSSLYLEARRLVWRASLGNVIGRRGPPDHLRVYLREPPEETREAWRVTRAIVKELELEARRARSELLVFYVPPVSVVDLDARREFLARLPEADWDLDGVADHLWDLCEELDVSYIDPVSALREEEQVLRAVGESLYYEDDGHWNPAGHELVAGILADWIRAAFVRD